MVSKVNTNVDGFFVYLSKEYVEFRRSTHATFTSSCFVMFLRIDDIRIHHRACCAQFNTCHKHLFSSPFCDVSPDYNLSIYAKSDEAVPSSEFLVVGKFSFEMMMVVHHADMHDPDVRSGWPRLFHVRRKNTRLRPRLIGSLETLPEPSMGISTP